MDYENFYSEAQVLEKAIKDKLTVIQRNFKSIVKNSEKGDLKNLIKDISQMEDTLNEFSESAGNLHQLAESFDAEAYVSSGEFAKQIIRYCERYAVDIKGESPTFEIFPYKIRIDAENQDMYINRKKLQCLRPLSFVTGIKQNLEKYTKAGFNAGTFLNELASAYDLAVIVKKSKEAKPRQDYDLLLRDLYEYLAPTSRSRREYDLQNYAFDLARLHASDIEYTKDERKFEFGSSRVTSKLIRILDRDGREQFMGTIRFYKPD